MSKFIGIHTFLNGQIRVEIGEYESFEDALEDMERNDSSLIVLSEREFNRINSVLENPNTPFNILLEI